MKKIIIIGAGGHSEACINIIDRDKSFEITAILDNKKTGNILNYQILGNDNLIDQLRDEIENAFIGVGQIKEYLNRRNIYDRLKEKLFILPNIISLNSIVSKFTNIQDGNIIMDNAVIGPKVYIGTANIINTGSVIEHGVKIDNFCHISTNVVINGEAKIGEGTFIGSGSIIANGVNIGKNCFIKMGSKITSDLLDDTKI